MHSKRNSCFCNTLGTGKIPKLVYALYSATSRLHTKQVVYLSGVGNTNLLCPFVMY